MGESAQAPAVPTGSTATARGGGRSSPNEWAENRSPVQSNHRVKRKRSQHQKRNGHWHRTPLVSWFRGQPEFRDAAFVMVGDWPMDEARINGGNEFLRLAAGLTKAGSLVGTCTHVLHT